MNVHHMPELADGRSLPPDPARSLVDRWKSWRDRKLMDPRFQRWAARFPLTRTIAARRASQLFDLCAGFVYSQVLFACVRLQLFDLLKSEPLDAATIARRINLEGDATLRLLEAATALELLERRGGDRFGLGELGAALLGNPGVTAMIRHHELLYADLADPVALLSGERKGTRLADYWAYATAARPESLSREAVSDYTDLMSASQPLVAQDVLDAYDFSRHVCLLDVGGGNGTFLSAVAERVPSLRLQLFDLPGVVEHARTYLAKHGIAERVSCVGGSFRSDALPVGADAVSLIRILHDHDDDVVMDLLAKVRRCLAPGGTVVIGEPLSGTSGAESMGDAYFGMYLHAMGSGRPRTAARLTEMLGAAGFEGIRQIPTARPLLVAVLTARRIG